jgi:hypothetical protein
MGAGRLRGMCVACVWGVCGMCLGGVVERRWGMMGLRKRFCGELKGLARDGVKGDREFSFE